MSLMLANAAIPVFFPQPLLMLAALVPIVVVEGFLLKRTLGVSYREVLAANVLSTACGIPLAFLAILCLDAGLTRGENGWLQLGFSSSILSRGLQHWWILPLAILAVALPCFALSVFVEGRYFRRRVRPVDTRILWAAVVRANGYSYAVLLAIDCLWLRAQVL